MKKSATENREAAGPKQVVPKKKKTAGHGLPISYPHAPSIHNGSAGAFDATEDSHDDDEDGPDNDDLALHR